MTPSADTINVRLFFGLERLTTWRRSRCLLLLDPRDEVSLFPPLGGG
jgi:hypothetical protein